MRLTPSASCCFLVALTLRCLAAQETHAREEVIEPIVSGSGHPVVLIGGGLQGADSWGPVVKRLEPMRKVIRLQNLNVAYGLKGEQPPTGYSVKMESAAAGRALDQLGLQQFDLVGWSSGGVIALDYALNHPERVRTLTLIEPTAIWVLGAEERKDPALARMTEMLRKLHGNISDEQFEVFLCGNGSFNCADASPRSSPMWMRLVRYKQALNGLPAYLDHSDDIGRLRAFRKPVLIVTGSQSATFAKNIDRALERHMPLAKGIELPGGHASFLNAADLFIKRITEFWEEAAGRQR